jgi:hypothetical protein
LNNKQFFTEFLQKYKQSKLFLEKLFTSNLILCLNIFN